MSKCMTCLNRYSCDDQFEFSCKKTEYIRYSKDTQAIKELSEAEIKLKPEDIFTNVYNPNMDCKRTSVYFDGCTGVKVLHRKTGIEVKCHKESSQIKNRDICIEGIKAMLKKINSEVNND